jgi:phenylalanyl-tRNA synthetase alpha subunit
MKTVMLELELSALEDGSEHPLEYIMGDLKEFFENFGWKVVSTNQDEIEDED